MTYRAACETPNLFPMVKTVKGFFACRWLAWPLLQAPKCHVLIYTNLCFRDLINRDQLPALPQFWKPTQTAALRKQSSMVALLNPFMGMTLRTNWRSEVLCCTSIRLTIYPYMKSVHQFSLPYVWLFILSKERYDRAGKVDRLPVGSMRPAPLLPVGHANRFECNGNMGMCTKKFVLQKNNTKLTIVFGNVLKVNVLKTLTEVNFFYLFKDIQINKHQVRWWYFVDRQIPCGSFRDVGGLDNHLGAVRLELQREEDNDNLYRRPSWSRYLLRNKIVLCSNIAWDWIA